jgi:hypothetical protein
MTIRVHCVTAIYSNECGCLVVIGCWDPTEH